MQECIFCKIANKEIPKEFTYEDEDVVVFPDINPVKKIHLLVIPKKHIPEFKALDDLGLFEKLAFVVQKMIKKHQELEDGGHRIVINGGGAQVVDHLHIHLMGPVGKAVAV